MTLSAALFLGLLQGLTEFLPVSSSGHLVIAQKILGFSEPPVLFDILLHVGSLVAVFIFFRKILGELIQKTWESTTQGKFHKIPRIVGMVVIGTIPAMVIGLILNDYLEAIFNSVILVGVTLVVTAGLLFSTTLIKKGEKKLQNISWLDALVVGLLQAVAILPGVSRSGSTVVAGLWRKLDRETAFTFSFLLSIPAILGAMTLQLKDLAAITNGQFLANGAGFLISAISSYLALILFKKVVVQGKIVYFGAYCLIIGLGTLLLLA